MFCYYYIFLTNNKCSKLKGDEKMAVASLVLGILSIVLSFFGPFVQIFGGILGIVGIVLGSLAKKNIEKKGMATAGVVCSIIGTILCFLFWIACAACVGSLYAL